MAFARRHGFKLAVTALVLLMAGYLLYAYLPKQEKLPELWDVKDFALTDLDGEELAFSESAGKVRLVYFFFASCPDVCPPTTNIASQVQDELKARGDFGEKVEFHWISIDPARDTPEVLQGFANGYGADTTGWHFLRGEGEEIVRIAQEGFNLGVRTGKPDELIHSDIIAVVDQDGKVRSYIRGGGDTTLTPERILETIDALL